MAKNRLSKQKILDLLLDIAEDVDNEAVKAGERIRAMQQICLMEGYNEVQATDIDFSKLVLQFGKKKRN